MRLHGILAGVMGGILACGLLGCGNQEPSGTKGTRAGGTSLLVWDAAVAKMGGSLATSDTDVALGGRSASGGMVTITGGSLNLGGVLARAGAAPASGGGALAIGGTVIASGGTMASSGGKVASGGIAVAGTIGMGGAMAPSGGRAASGGTPSAGGTTSSPKPRATFRNPLNTSHGSDPFMTYYQGNYYLAATTWGTTLTMKRGAAISALKSASPSVIWRDSTASRSGNMWAPEFYLLDNGAGQKRWYHYYTAGDGTDLATQRAYVLESDGTDPMGPYHFKAQLINYWAIDTSILHVGGQLYLLFSAWQGATQNIWVVGMTNPWTVRGSRTLLSQPTYAWEQEGTDPVNEGPVALYREGRTFVAYSASHCASPGYKLGLLELTGSNPLATGSWTKSATPVFQSANGAYGTGHNGFFTSPDGSEHWIVYHAVTRSAGSCWTDRTTRIQAITWNPDGTPNFGTPLNLTTDIPVPSGE